jgi:hypothetical protein
MQVVQSRTERDAIAREVIDKVGTGIGNPIRNV